MRSFARRSNTSSSDNPDERAPPFDLVSCFDDRPATMRNDDSHDHHAETVRPDQMEHRSILVAQPSEHARRRFRARRFGHDEAMNKVAIVRRPVNPLGPESGNCEGSTLPRNPSVNWQRFEQALRALAVLVVFGVVGYALFGCAGLTTATSSETSGALSATVTYASTTRPGLVDTVHHCRRDRRRNASSGGDRCRDSAPLPLDLR